MGDSHHQTAARAVRTLRSREWLDKDIVQGADLIFADLRDLNLTAGHYNKDEVAKAFDESRLNDIVGSDFREAKLNSAKLMRSLLIKCDLTNADLSNADLTSANLTGAILDNAVLNGTNFNHAIVTDNQLEKAESMQVVIMPSGVLYNGRFNLDADIRAHESLLPSGSFGQIGDFYRVPDNVYQRGQNWRKWRNELMPPIYTPEFEEWGKATHYPDGGDLY